MPEAAVLARPPLPLPPAACATGAPEAQPPLRRSSNPPWQERATMKELMRSELFVPRYAIPLEEERELALRRLEVRCAAGPGGAMGLPVDKAPCAAGSTLHASKAACARRSLLWRHPLTPTTPPNINHVQVLCRSGCFRIEDFRSDPMRIFAAHEVAAFADVSMATKMTVQVGQGADTPSAQAAARLHAGRCTCGWACQACNSTASPCAQPPLLQFNLFGGTVLKLGTARHHDLLLRGITSLDDVGCFALTELGYGGWPSCLPVLTEQLGRSSQYITSSCVCLLI